MKYEQAREDFEYLEQLAELTDQVDLDSEREALMRNPTKLKAGSMYMAAVRLWFQEHGEEWRTVSGVAEVAERHDIA